MLHWQAHYAEGRYAPGSSCVQFQGLGMEDDHQGQELVLLRTQVTELLRGMKRHGLDAEAALDREQ